MRLRALLVAATVFFTGLVVAAPTAQAACAAPSSRWVGGTVKGQDGWDVNVQVSISIETANGVQVGMDGCRTTAYAKYVFVNRLLSAEGAPHSSKTVNTWKFTGLPSNAAYVWIENYPRAPGNPQCSTCAGPVDMRKYAKSMRRKVPVNRGDVRLTLPLVCGRGGRTGKIWGHMTNSKNQPIQPDSIYAWSEAPDSPTFLMGWGTGAYANGYFSIDKLASDQTYVIWVSKRGYPTKRYYGVRVNYCKTTPLWMRIG